MPTQAWAWHPAPGHPAAMLPRASGFCERHGHKPVPLAIYGASLVDGGGAPGAGAEGGALVRQELGDGGARLSAAVVARGFGREERLAAEGVGGRRGLRAVGEVEIRL